MQQNVYCMIVYKKCTAGSAMERVPLKKVIKFRLVSD
jgi:hypothetical protein